MPERFNHTPNPADIDLENPLSNHGLNQDLKFWLKVPDNQGRTTYNLVNRKRGPRNTTTLPPRLASNGTFSFLKTDIGTNTQTGIYFPPAGNQEFYNLPSIPDKLTASSLIRFRPAGGGYFNVHSFTWDASGSATSFSITGTYIAGGSITFGFFGDSADLLKLPLNTWLYLTQVYYKGYWKQSFVNGELIDSSGLGTGLPATEPTGWRTNVITYDTYGYGQTFSIAQKHYDYAFTKVWTRALSQAEIRADYNDSLNGSPLTLNYRPRTKIFSGIVAPKKTVVVPTRSGLGHIPDPSELDLENPLTDHPLNSGLFIYWKPTTQNGKEVIPDLLKRNSLRFNLRAPNTKVVSDYAFGCIDRKGGNAGGSIIPYGWNTTAANYYSPSLPNDWTYINWIKLREYDADAALKNVRVLWAVAKTSNDRIAYNVDYINSTLIVDTFLSSSGNSVASFTSQNGVIPLDNKWRCVAIRKTLDAFIEVFLDGQLLGSFTTTATLSGGWNTIEPYLTGTNAATNFRGNMRMADVRIYSRSLSNAEINTLYNDGLTGNRLTLNYRPRRLVFDTINQAPSVSVPLNYYTLTAAAGSFTLTGNATGLTRQLKMTASVGQFTLTGNATGLTRQLKVATSVSQFTLTGNDASLTRQSSLAVSVGQFTLTGNASGLTAQRTLAVDTGSFTLTGNSVVLNSQLMIVAGSGSFTLTGNATVLQKATLFSVDAGSFAITGNDVGLYFGKTVQPAVGSFTLTGNDANLITSGKLQAGTGSFILAGNDTGLFLGASLSAGTGSFTSTGNNATLTESIVLAVDAGSFTLTGNDVAFSKTYRVAVEVGQFTLTGSATGLLSSRTLPTSVGQFTLTGNDVAFAKAKALLAETGSFTFTGYAVVLQGQRSFTAGTGSFTVTGNAAGLARQITLSCTAGNFSLSGQTTNLLLVRKVSCAAGSFSLTGNATSFIWTHKLAAVVGQFDLTGSNALLARGRYFSVDTKAYTLTCLDVSLLYGHRISPIAGNFPMTGNDVAIKLSRMFPVAVGPFQVTGYDNNLISNAITLVEGIDTPMRAPAALDYIPGSAPAVADYAPDTAAQPSDYNPITRRTY